MHLHMHHACMHTNSGANTCNTDTQIHALPYIHTYLDMINIYCNIRFYCGVIICRPMNYFQ